MKTLFNILLVVLGATVLHYVGDIHVIDSCAASVVAGGAMIGHVRMPHITADATSYDQAYLQRTLLPQLVNEYKNDNEGFISVFNGVPKSAIGTEGIYKNRLVDTVEGVLDNTVDFDAPGDNDKKSLFCPWSTVDTKPSKVKRSELRGLPYDLKSTLRTRHMQVIKRLTRDKLLHTISPAANSADTPILGLSDGMNYEWFIKVRTLIMNMNMDPRDFAVIMSPEHVADCANQQGAGTRFREVMFNEVSGKVKGFAGFENVFEHSGMPKFDPYNLTRNALGSLNGTAGTLIVNIQEVLFHREDMALYLKPGTQDTRSADPGDEFRLGGYFAADTLVKKGFFALVDEA